MKERFLRFMQGRYGVDEFSRFLIWMVIAFWLLAIVIRMGGSGSHTAAAAGTICDYISFAAIIYSWFRMFSKNIVKRQNENRMYLKYKQKISGIFKSESKDKSHKIYKCPKCGQKIRVPKNKGKIAISCPNCSTEFVKRT